MLFSNGNDATYILTKTHQILARQHKQSERPDSTGWLHLNNSVLYTEYTTKNPV